MKEFLGIGAGQNYNAYPVLSLDNVASGITHCISGFDNIGVEVRNCYFESSCSIFRFGGTNVLVENCEAAAPATYGHRWGLTDEEKRNRAPSVNCRHNCLTAFLYYCDDRANVRKNPGNILIRNCSFKNPDTMISIPFGHLWCSNRSCGSCGCE